MEGQPAVTGRGEWRSVLWYHSTTTLVPLTLRAFPRISRGQIAGLLE